MRTNIVKCDFCGKVIKNGSCIFRTKRTVCFGELESGFIHKEKEYDCCDDCHKRIMGFAKNINLMEAKPCQK